MNEREFCKTFDGIKADKKELEKIFKLFKSRYMQIAKNAKKLYKYGDKHMFIDTEAGRKPKHKRIPAIKNSLESIYNFEYEIKSFEDKLKKF